MKINNITNLEQYMITGRQVMEGDRSFMYLGAVIKSKNVISEEIKSRIAAVNRRFYSLEQIFKSRPLSKRGKIKT